MLAAAGVFNGKSPRFNIPSFMVYGGSCQYMVGRSKRVLLRVHFDGEIS
jgi:hypothetical protein